MHTSSVGILPWLTYDMRPFRIYLAARFYSVAAYYGNAGVDDMSHKGMVGVETTTVREGESVTPSLTRPCASSVAVMLAPITCISASHRWAGCS